MRELLCRSMTSMLSVRVMFGDILRLILILRTDHRSRRWCVVSKIEVGIAQNGCVCVPASCIQTGLEISGVLVDTEQVRMVSHPSLLVGSTIPAYGQGSSGLRSAEEIDLQCSSSPKLVPALGVYRNFRLGLQVYVMRLSRV
ncbi:hypothetical protein RRG08_043629 [Elysia crispata]|uniref:Uncharacterized protein n=1 Tax=Elysia crispata TaxID=231223 RepID=A0AAE1A7N3_9GAST|nr:hypothetical protein RRG08_043629 [Elysia crispata]